MSENRQVTIMGETADVPEGVDFVFDGIILGPKRRGAVTAFGWVPDWDDESLSGWEVKECDDAITFCEAAIVHFEGKANTLAEARQACIHETRGIINPKRFSNVSTALKRELDNAETWWHILEKVRAVR